MLSLTLPQILLLLLVAPARCSYRVSVIATAVTATDIQGVPVDRLGCHVFVAMRKLLLSTVVVDGSLLLLVHLRVVIILLSSRAHSQHLLLLRRVTPELRSVVVRLVTRLPEALGCGHICWVLLLLASVIVDDFTRIT